MRLPTTLPMRVAIATIVAVAFLPPILAGQQVRTLSYGEPEDVGMSSAGLASAVEMYQEAVQRGELVGAVILIARKGRVVLHEAMGWRDATAATPRECRPHRKEEAAGCGCWIRGLHDRLLPAIPGVEWRSLRSSEGVAHREIDN